MRIIQTYQGKGVYNAVAVGRIALFRKENPVVKCVHVAETEREKARFEQAKALTARQLREIYEETLRKAGAAGAAIFEVHQMLLEDAAYNDSIRNMIEDTGVNAEYAVAVTADNFEKKFSAMDDAYMKARAADIRDISNRLISNLTGMDSRGKDSMETDSPGMDSPGTDSRGRVIICAYDLAPSETAAFDKEKVLAFVTAQGSFNSHTAILARNMNIPAVVGAGDEFLNDIRDGDEVIVDGGTGEVFVNPDEETRVRFLEKQRGDEEKKRLLQELKGKKNVTLDGRKIDVYANIGGIGDIKEALANDAGGIGLFRSEFLYLENRDYPTE